MLFLRHHSIAITIALIVGVSSSLSSSSVKLVTAADEYQQKRRRRTRGYNINQQHQRHEEAQEQQQQQQQQRGGGGREGSNHHHRETQGLPHLPVHRRSLIIIGRTKREHDEAVTPKEAAHIFKKGNTYYPSSVPSSDERQITVLLLLPLHPRGNLPPRQQLHLP